MHFQVLRSKAIQPPYGVVDAELDDVLMQSIANEMNLSEDCVCEARIRRLLAPSLVHSRRRSRSLWPRNHGYSPHFV